MKKLLKKKENGQAMVEFALLLPVLLLLVCGIIDFAWLAFNQLSLNNACREAARYAAVNTTVDSLETVLEAKAEDEAPDIYIDGIDVRLVYSNSSDKTNGDLTVYCTANMNIFTPVLGTINGGQTKLISAAVTMRVES